MRIKVLNPDYGISDAGLRERECKLAAVLRPDTEVHMECVTRTEVFVDSQKDVALAARELIELAVKAENDGFDAIVLYCGSDPAITAIREMVRIPVVGGGLASFLYANALGYSFSLLTTGIGRAPEKRAFVSSLGYRAERLRSVRGLSIPDDAIHGDRENTMALLEAEAKKCVLEDGAEVIVLGCLSFLGYAAELSARVGIPVIDPCYASVLLAESLVTMGLAHSKVSYPAPPVTDLPAW
ncbi:aspartate/glutamate racemase family protein [Oscillospiraceae bacterium OttesenSCG-928-G22]|nr:aspartate/glutamate racemase family protein [Oscillospiraceae bacterium OttesenSCG-928-G22]